MTCLKAQRNNQQMQYVSITLCKYKRLALNHIDYIQITPFNKIQLILGTNGSGKSSLLSQITPLPADHKDYQRGGYKVIELVHNNSRYTLKSLFTEEGNKYHFIKDGVELNDGLTAATYRELVRKEFRITQDVQDIMTGYQTFTRMEVGNRRNWFTKISDADYTYAIKFFTKLKEQHRDMIGAIKLHQARLVQESEKLLTPEAEAKYRQEIKIFNELLSSLLNNKTPLRVSKFDTINEVRRLEGRLETLGTSIRKLRGEFPNYENFTNESEIERAVINAQADIQSLTNDIEKICVKIEKHDDLIQTLKHANVGSIEDVDNAIDAHMNLVQSFNSQMRLNLDIKDPKSALQALQTVQGSLSTIAQTLEVNAEKKYSRDNYELLLVRIKDRTVSIANLEAKLAHHILSKKELEHLKDHGELECPQCSHKWIRGFDQIQYNRLTETISSLVTAIDEQKKEAEADEMAMQACRTYLETYRGYIGISREWVILNPLWDHLVQSGIIFNTPSRITQVMESLRGDLTVGIKKEDAANQLKVTMALKEALEKNQETSISKMIQDSEDLHSELHSLNRHLQYAKFTASRLNVYRASVKEMDAIANELDSLCDQRLSKTEDLIDIARTEALNDAIQLVQLELYEREQMITKIDVQKAVIMNIQLQIMELKEKSEVLKLAITELSPSQGLIAKGLTGFINHFVAQVNNFIKKIWLYPMELTAIVPDEDDGVDLDYKFEVKVNDDSIIPDVSKGSAGMREIIDLAFKVVSMQYLGLDKAPLHLDEFGVALDAAHRHSAHYAITNLINSSNFSQIFMVSHYESSYGSLTNADICVLHDANINVPKGLVYNKHVILK